MTAQIYVKPRTRIWMRSCDGALPSVTPCWKNKVYAYALQCFWVAAGPDRQRYWDYLPYADNDGDPMGCM